MHGQQAPSRSEHGNQTWHAAQCSPIHPSCMTRSLHHHHQARHVKMATHCCEAGASNQRGAAAHNPTPKAEKPRPHIQPCNPPLNTTQPPTPLPTMTTHSGPWQLLPCCTHGGALTAAAAGITDRGTLATGTHWFALDDNKPTHDHNPRPTLPVACRTQAVAWQYGCAGHTPFTPTPLADTRNPRQTPQVVDMDDERVLPLDRASAGGA